MLKILVPTTTLLLTTWTTPHKWLWPTTTASSIMIAMTSFLLSKNMTETGWGTLGAYLGTDLLSIPLIVLTCWLLPLMILASQNHMKYEPENRQRMYIALLTFLQIFLLMAFSATELTMFYISFEATLIPTLILITRWGNQTERLNAGAYFLFYTLAASLPLLVALMALQKYMGTLSIMNLQYSLPLYMGTLSAKFWWLACLSAFLVKLPLYGVHLWLPKAHVEAPIAGSMVLAAVLLKLGGYGMMRVMIFLEPATKELSLPFVVLALWGVIMTSSICLRQADLKALIAYSSVSHMGLVIAATLTQTSWSFSGAMTLMISHGLTSSALFCLANMNYERTHTRTMLVTRGMQIILPMLATWWFVSSIANLALPPLPNLVGELMILVSLFFWSPWTLMLTGLGTLITAAYSLYMFLMTNRGPAPQHLTALDPSHSREHLLIILHLLPLVLLITKPHIIY